MRFIRSGLRASHNIRSLAHNLFGLAPIARAMSESNACVCACVARRRIVRAYRASLPAAAFECERNAAYLCAGPSTHSHVGGAERASGLTAARLRRQRRRLLRRLLRLGAPLVAPPLPPRHPDAHPYPHAAERARRRRAERDAARVRRREHARRVGRRGRRRAKDLVAAAGAATAKVVELAAVEEVAQFAAGAVVRPGAFEVAAGRHCAGGAAASTAAPADTDVSNLRRRRPGALAAGCTSLVRCAAPLARWPAKEATWRANPAGSTAPT